MRKLLAVLFCAASLYGQILQTVAATSLPVRYISQSAGSDSNDGLSEKTAWQTLAKVNAATLLAGNTVAQKTGDTWRETLTPGQSGSAGAPITFTSYGSGAQPIISGANIITGWTSTTVSPNLVAQPNVLSNAYWTPTAISSFSGPGTDPLGATTAYGIVGTAANTTHEIAHTTNITGLSAATSYDMVVYAKPGNQSWLFFDVQFWNGASFLQTYQGWWNVTAGTTGNVGGSPSPAITITSAGGGWYQCKLTITSPASTNAAQLAILPASGNGSFSYLGTGTTTDMQVWGVALRPTAATSTTVYYESLATQPISVFYDSTFLTAASSAAALMTGQYFYDTVAGVLYVFDNPSGHTVTASQRGVVVDLFQKSYITLSSLKIEKNNSSFQGGVQIDGQSTESTGIVVQGCTIAYTVGGIYVFSANNVTLRGNTVFGDPSISVAGYTVNQGSGNASQNLTVSGGMVHDVQLGLNSPVSGVTANFNVATISGGTWYNLQNNGINANYGTSVVIDSNLVYNGGLSVDDTAGIHTGFCTNCTISNNVVHDWHAPVTNINGSGILVDIGSSGNVVKYNYSYNNQTAGITITDAPNTSIYNNTLYNNGRDAANTNGAGIWVGGPSKTSTGIIADNLVQASAVDANSRVIYFATPTEFSGFTFATNLWYLPGGTNWGYNGASNFSSIATWNAQTEVLSPDLNANPTLTNPPTDVTLQSGSPAIGAGVFIPGVSTANPPNIGAK